MQIILHFLAQHWLLLLILLGIYVLIEIYAWYGFGPTDISGNGITIGSAKAFDNRSLALRIERLSSSLENLKVVNQSATENLTAIQGQTSSEVTLAASFQAKGAPPQAEKKEGADRGEEEKPGKTVTATESQRTEEKPTVALTASDILTDQLNLASQILNLETLYERSLSDRLFERSARLQTVLGFQVSITPPSGCENSVAIIEVAVRTKENKKPVSLVALIPQEKTYNSQTVSSSSKSIGGSAVASVLSLGVTGKGESRQLYIHRDSDTVAFERTAPCKPSIFEDGKDELIFGWEFRPVLGRRAVSAGIRQMLAVIAIPAKEDEQPGEVALEIRTRCYWRKFNAKKQTSRRKWSLLPWKIDRSRKQESDLQELKIANTAMILADLAPTVSSIKWVNSGNGRATVIVEGENFFSGTKVVTGGTVFKESKLATGGTINELEKLTLKSDRCLEFETTVNALALGDSVLIGRFGPSIQLAIDKAKRPAETLEIFGVQIEPSRYTNATRIHIDVRALDDGTPVPLTVKHLQNLPEPILFVGTEAVPMPYDYYDRTIGEDDVSTSYAGTGPGAPPSLEYIRVKAWIPKALAASPSVSFRIPFCGLEYHTSVPLSSSERPTITRLGSDADNYYFRISHTERDFLTKAGLSVQIDRLYLVAPDLVQLSDYDYMLTVSATVVSRYQNLVVKVGKLEPYLLPIPAEITPKPKATIDSSAKPPQLIKDTLGPLEWSGSALNLIKQVKFHQPPLQANGTAAKPLDAQFAVYEGGKRIEVILPDASTSVCGKAAVEFKSSDEPGIGLPVFILKDASS